jgi:hypothetical protein
MSSRKRSAAAAIQATPESADVLTRRAALCRDMPERLDHLQRVLDLARRSLGGPDPEASLGYLARLAHHAGRARADFQ